MNNFDRQLIELLIDLKENHNVIAVKTEFETEGTSFDEANYLKELTQISNLDLTIKIGGCGALNDILQAKKINAKTIVAPMIESPYALEKFIQTVNAIYEKKELNDTRLFINIETITGVENLNKIINSIAFENINGVVLGRNDLVSSMTKEKYTVNSEDILEISNIIAKEIEKRNKQLIIGGCVDELSINFFEKIKSPAFVGFETRKIVFKKGEDIKKESILKAIEFEIIWLKNKSEKNYLDIKRINYLENIFIK